MSYYDEGVRAYHNDEHDNPYPPGTNAFRNWQHGHDDAHDRHWDI